MIVRLTLDALADIARIKTHFDRIDGALATRVLAHVRRTLGMLAGWPHLGKPGRRIGTRETLLPRMPYVVVYRIDLGREDALVVLRVRQSR